MVQRRPFDAVAGVERQQHADWRLVHRDAVDRLQDAVVAELEVVGLQPGDGAASLGDERVNSHDFDAAAKPLGGRLASGDGDHGEQGDGALHRQTSARRRLSVGPRSVSGSARYGPERFDHAPAGSGEMARDCGAGLWLTPLAHQHVRKRQRRGLSPRKRLERRLVLPLGVRVPRLALGDRPEEHHREVAHGTIRRGRGQPQRPVGVDLAPGDDQDATEVERCLHVSRIAGDRVLEVSRRVEERAVAPPA